MEPQAVKLEPEKSEVPHRIATWIVVLACVIVFSVIALLFVPKRYDPASDCFGYSYAKTENAVVEYHCVGLVIAGETVTP